MIKRKVFVSLFLSVLFLNASVFADEKFPFLAEASSDKVNVRSGQNTNFEKVASLNKGEAIVVYSREFDWYKIQLPATAKVYIRADYATKIGVGSAIVTGTAVNVRAGAGTNFTAVGQFKKDEQIQILAESGEWLQVQPKEGMFAWVKKDFVTFKSSDIPPLASLNTENNHLSNKKLIQDAPRVSAFSIKVSGKLESNVSPTQASGALQLTQDGQTLYSIAGSDIDFTYFLNNQITLEGRVLENSKTTLEVPVLAVSKVMLVL